MDQPAKERSRTHPRFSKPWWRRVGQAFHMAGRDFLIDNGPSWAAAIAFYGLLSLFPLLLALVSVAAQLVEPEWAATQLATRLGDFLPRGEEQIREIVQEAYAAGAGTGIISIVLLLWSGSYVFGAMTTALNLAYDVDETYGFFKRLLIRAVMLATLGVLFVLALSSRWVVTFFADTLGLLPAAEQGWLISAARAVVPALLLVLSFFLIYRFVPRRRPNWRAALVGAVGASLAFLIARPLFIGYLQHIGTDYNVIYGSLGIGIILMFWVWIVAVILLLGGELSSHVQAIVIEGQSVEEVNQRHLGRSPDRKEEATERAK
jgi:membrane protein